MLVTAGGGGDGAELMNQVLDAYVAFPIWPCRCYWCSAR